MSHKINLEDLPKEVLELLPFLKDLKDLQIFMGEAKFEFYSEGHYHTVEWNDRGAITFCPDVHRHRR